MDTKLEDNQTKEKLGIPEEIEVLVVNMNQTLFEGKAKSLIAPGPLGNFAVLPGHTPMFTKVEKGTLLLDAGQEKPKEIPVDGGIAKITQFKATILVGFDELKPPKK